MFNEQCSYTMNGTGNDNELQRLLLDGTNANAMDPNGNTALILAAKQGDSLSQSTKISSRNLQSMDLFWCNLQKSKRLRF